MTRSIEDLMPIIEVRDMAVDVLLKKRAESLIGEVAINSLVVVETIDEFDVESNLVVNLAEAIEFARNGDARAEQMIRSNVTTDYIERAYKTGFVSEVTLEKREDGEIVQYGQSIEAVHVNSLRHMSNEKLRQRAKIEALNSVRDKYYVNHGLLRDNARVTFSLVHGDMDDKEAEDVGFFVHSRSISIQLMTELDSGELILQSAFVAGRDNLSDSSYDVQAISRLAEKLGVDYSGQSTEEILSRPLLIHKDLLPDLSLSVVKLFDESAAEVTGKQKFFGVDTDVEQHRESYKQKLDHCRKLTSDMEQDITKVIEELKSYRTIEPTEATAKLAELNDRLLKQRIVYDESIDARVLGTKASYFVNHARALMQIESIPQHQLIREMMILQNKINSEGGSNSCPGGSNGRKNDGLNNNFDFGFESEDDQDSTSESKLKDCEFISKECPKCGEKNVKTECKNGKYYGACGCSSNSGKAKNRVKDEQFTLAA